MNKSEQAKYDKERYDRLRKNGICVVCKENKTEVKGVRCINCKEKANAEHHKRREERRTRKVCTGCGKNRDDERYIKCNNCRRIYNESSKRLYDKNAAKGLCGNCGKPKNIEGKICDDCKNKYRKKFVEQWKNNDPHATHPTRFKVCNTCKVEKVVKEFNIRRNSKDGLYGKCKKCESSNNRKNKYGVAFDLSNMQCTICKSTENLVIDHNHKTGNIRGILCGNCNTGLGMFNDNIQSLQVAIRYLRYDFTMTVLSKGQYNAIAVKRNARGSRT